MPSLRQLIQNAIAYTLPPAESSGSVLDIPVKRVQQHVAGILPSVAEHGRIQYVSAIAQRLAASRKQSPGAIAQELAQELGRSLPELLNSDRRDPRQSRGQERICPHLRIEATDAGWIFFSLSDPGLAVWLETQYQLFRDALSQSSYPSLSKSNDTLHLSSSNGLSVTDPDPYSSPESASRVQDSQLNRQRDLIWHGQYAHARCCAVMRLATEMGIACRRPQWLHGETLRSHTPADVTLIGSLIDAWDHETLQSCHSPLDHKQYRRLEHRLRDLSQHMLTLYAQYPLWGDIFREDAELVIVRLALLQIARGGLALILEKGFGAIAPEFL